MPRRRAEVVADRALVCLEPEAGLTPLVGSRREQLFPSFGAWTDSEVECKFEQLSGSGLLLGTSLVGYGKFLFYGGYPKYMFSETTNAVNHRFKHFRPHWAPAWAVLSRWQEEEPSERGIVLLEALLKAALAVAFAWGWPRFAAALLLGFHGLLRPGEILGLRRRDLILPRDLLSTTRIAYVRILYSKTQRLIQRQHAKISDALSVELLEAVFGDLPPQAKMFQSSPAVFRKRWNLIFQFLRIPTSEGTRGVTPKSLRGSGATWLHQRTEDISKIQWRGRWHQRRTLEFYLQEVAGQLLLASLTKSQRSRVSQLAALAHAALLDFLAGPALR